MVLCTFNCRILPNRITGAMGKGLAALTFDKDYQKKRREALNKKPANLQEGLARSGKGLVMVSNLNIHCYDYVFFGISKNFISLFITFRELSMG